MAGGVERRLAAGQVGGDAQRREVPVVGYLRPLVVHQVLRDEDGQRQGEQSDGEDRGDHHDGDDLPAHATLPGSILADPADGRTTAK